jgi:hypothetical protein
VLNQLEANGLKNVRGVRRCETEPNRYGIYEPAIARYQRFPGVRVAFQAQGYEFAIRVRFVLYRSHYLIFLAFQNDCREKVSIKIEKNADPNTENPVRQSQLVTISAVFRYSATVFKENMTASARNKAPIISSQSFLAVLRKSPKTTLSLPAIH